MMPELDETGKLVAGATGLVLALGLAVLVYKLTRPKCAPREKCPQLDPKRCRWVHKDSCGSKEPRCIPHVLKPLKPLKR